MHEMLYAAPQNRLPVVMVNVNRSLGAAAGIWLEHNDSMPERESGWLQVTWRTTRRRWTWSSRRSASPRTTGSCCR